MVSFLLIISFLLHIVTLYAIFILYKQFQTNKKKDVSEITTLFDEYIQQIKQENLRLQQEIQRDSRKEKVDRHDPDENTLQMQQEKPVAIEKPILKVDNIKDSMEASLEAKVLQFYHEGLSVTEIAKKLNCGKTEAELIIKLHKKISK